MYWYGRLIGDTYRSELGLGEAERAGHPLPINVAVADEQLIAFGSLKTPSEYRRDHNPQVIMIRDDRHQQLPLIPD